MRCVQRIHAKAPADLFFTTQRKPSARRSACGFEVRLHTKVPADLFLFTDSVNLSARLSACGFGKRLHAAADSQFVCTPKRLQNFFLLDSMDAVRTPHARAPADSQLVCTPRRLQIRPNESRKENKNEKGTLEPATSTRTTGTTGQQPKGHQRRAPRTEETRTTRAAGPRTTFRQVSPFVFSRVSPFRPSSNSRASASYSDDVEIELKVG